MKLERTKDAEFIRSIVTQPSVWPYAVDEGHDPATWQPCLDDSCAWLRCEGVAGVVLVYRVSGLIYAYDAALLPVSRAHAIGFAERRKHIDLLKEWLRENTDCRRLIAFIAADNGPSVRAAHADGLKLQGLLPQSKRRGDGFVDSLIFGMEV